MRIALPVALSTLLATPAVAGDLRVTVEVPKLNVAEYHRPYIAIWIERPNQSVAANLLVWYDGKLKNDEGTKWLKDLRLWWRKAGRELAMPPDGLSGATRGPGQHQVAWPSERPPLAALPAGEYELVVEAAREVGGREVLRVPFQWPPKGPTSARAGGGNELGIVTLTLTP
jgi:hypothetical protein